MKKLTNSNSYHASPTDITWISLDLETTGLSQDTDDIIEIGAVKFQGNNVIDTFQTMVNPHRTLDTFIKNYTGITQEDVDNAPPFSEISHGLASFIGELPILGHNIPFDLGFLKSKGLNFSNPRCDTWDLAFVLLPENREYSLSKLASSLGIEHPNPHRAIEDAKITMHVFIKLTEILVALDINTLNEIELISRQSDWILSYLLRKVVNDKISRDITYLTQTNMTTLNTQSLKKKLPTNKTLRQHNTMVDVDPDEIASPLKNGSPLANTIKGFEERPQQTEMARSITNAINNGGKLIVEAGTGVGKSLAYLLPSIIYSIKNNKRIVISTNTINLQEQLLTKDIPALVNSLNQMEDFSVDDFKYTQLKGRANYLCLYQWLKLRSGGRFSEDEARLMSKILVWLKSTASGDRSELNLAARKPAQPWRDLSAQGSRNCQGIDGICFLRYSRDKAAAAHLVVVNHALLMSDLVAGRSLIPDHDILIIDEAHHLEDEATRHLGFELRRTRIDDYLQSISGDNGLINKSTRALRNSSVAQTRKTTITGITSVLTSIIPTTHDNTEILLTSLKNMLQGMPEDISSAQREIRITSTTRTHPGWSQLEIQWENLDSSLGELQKNIEALDVSFADIDESLIPDLEILRMDILNILQQSEELREQLTEFASQPKEESIYWVSINQQRENMVLHSAPLNVGNDLEKLLFDQNKTVLLTSATLSTNNSFDYIRERTGFKNENELILGSPFDYPKAALLCIPRDMPEPNSWSFQSAMEQAITDTAIAASGHTMVLFTSHSSLQASASSIRENLNAHGINVLAQGIDGSPYQLIQKFLRNPKCVLMGTNSFWEGIDLPGNSLKVLLIARLPFNVPTEPVFAARSELYDKAFNDYAIPQAILRIRQGFGRLIRTKNDRGIVVILDKRIISKGYGKLFLKSLPPVSQKTCELLEIGKEVGKWLPMEEISN